MINFSPEESRVPFPDEQEDDWIDVPFGEDELPSRGPMPGDLTGRVELFFGEYSPLRQASEYGGRPYEERPQQRRMAQAIAEALEAGDHLCIEAPTGVGKSFAYLIPAIYHAVLTDRPVVVSTHTIALQEQLMQKDLPMLQQILDIPFSIALAKGRENYICTYRLNNAIQNQQEFLPSDDLKPEIMKLLDWSKRTKDGSRADLHWMPDRQTWAAVCSEAGTCPIEQGKEDGMCFFQKARRKLYKANVIVANHAIVCVDLATRRNSNGLQSLLPDYSALILDEAHTFPEVASTHLGMKVNTFGIRLLFDRLYRPRSNRGLLARDKCLEAREICVRVRELTEQFFGTVFDWVDGQDENPLAYTVPNHVPNHLHEPWGQLANALKMLLKEASFDEAFLSELKLVTERFEAMRETLTAFLAMQEPEYVYWFELFGRQHRHVSLNGVPIEVDKVLDAELFNQRFPVIMTSATMAVDQDLGYFRRQVGVGDARSEILDSPYDLAKQIEIFLPYKSMPLPKDHEAFMDAVCDQIRQFILKTMGKAFVLFTSYSFMATCAERLESFFKLNDILLMVQGQERSRTQMLDVFRKDINSVIFGTDSFWMGVDVPGESLSNVIIVKLPFPVPSHPLVSAKSKRLEERGGNSFRDYFLPEAVLKFRQGIGRLIRSKDDTGIIVVLDPRIMTTRYGQTFLDSLPDCQRHMF